MLIFSRPVAGLVLVAVAAGAYGYERLPPRNPSRSETAPEETPKPPPPSVLATAAPTAPAASKRPHA